MAYIQTRRTQDGKTRYRVQVRLKGTPTQTATFERKTDAKRWAEATETAIRERRYFKTREAQRRTLKAAIDRYFDEVLPGNRLKTRRTKRPILIWWRRQLGEYTLAELTTDLVATKRHELAVQGGCTGKPLNPATCNAYVRILSHVLTIALKRWAWLENHPLQHLDALPASNGRVRFLSDDERVRLLKACRQSWEPRLYPLTLLAISTGARRGELMGLRWRDIDLERGIAVLHETKNQERRQLMLAGSALEELRHYHQRCDDSEDQLIFAGARGKPRFPWPAWREALAAAEIEDFRFHDLRHTAASYLAMSGATLAEIAEVLGHKTLAMVKRYAHLTQSHTHSVVARMNEKYL